MPSSPYLCRNISRGIHRPGSLASSERTKTQKTLKNKLVFLRRQRDNLRRHQYLRDEEQQNNTRHTSPKSSVLREKCYYCGANKCVPAFSSPTYLQRATNSVLAWQHGFVFKLVSTFATLIAGDVFGSRDRVRFYVWLACIIQF